MASQDKHKLRDSGIRAIRCTSRPSAHLIPLLVLLTVALVITVRPARGGDELSPADRAALKARFGTTHPERWDPASWPVPATERQLRATRALGRRTLKLWTPNANTAHIRTFLNNEIQRSRLVFAFDTRVDVLGAFRPGFGRDPGVLLLNVEHAVQQDFGEIINTIAHEGQHARFSRWLRGHLRRAYNLVEGTAEFEEAYEIASKVWINETLAQRKGYLTEMDRRMARWTAEKAVAHPAYAHLRGTAGMGPKSAVEKRLCEAIVLLSEKDAQPVFFLDFGIDPDLEDMFRRPGPVPAIGTRGELNEMVRMVGAAQLVGELGGFDAVDRLAESQGFLMAGDIVEEDKLTIGEGLNDALFNNFGRTREVITKGREAAATRLALEEEATTRYEYANGTPRGNWFSRTWGWIRWYLPW